MPSQSGSANIGGSGSFTTSGLVVERTSYGLLRVVRYVGEKNIPGEIRRRRRSVHDMMRRLGTPVIVKHRFNIEDVQKGWAIESSNYDPVYGQARALDPLSHGVGFVSQELSADEWISPDGSEIVTSNTNPGGYTQAPKYRGFGPGYLTYAITPDAAFDFFKLTPEGAMLKIQSAQCTAPWFPDMNDNDLLIQVELDAVGNLVETKERFELKQQNPVTMRGTDRRGRRETGSEGGNRHVVNQVFEMALIPVTNVLYNVEVDR